MLMNCCIEGLFMRDGDQQMTKLDQCEKTQGKQLKKRGMQREQEEMAMEENEVQGKNVKR